MQKIPLPFLNNKSPIPVVRFPLSDGKTSVQSLIWDLTPPFTIKKLEKLIRSRRCSDYEVHSFHRIRGDERQRQGRDRCKDEEPHVYPQPRLWRFCQDLGLAKVKGVFKRLTTMWMFLTNENILAWTSALTAWPRMMHPA